MDVLELQQVDDFIQRSNDNVKYPHVLISGIATEEEVNYFHNKFNDLDKSLPLYFEFETVYKCIGSFELTLDNLLIIRSISNYSLTLMVDKDTRVAIDLSNPVQLLKFITLNLR